MTVLHLYLLILMNILLRKLKPFYNQLYLIMFVPKFTPRVSQRTVNFKIYPYHIARDKNYFIPNEYYNMSS